MQPVADGLKSGCSMCYYFPQSRREGVLNGGILSHLAAPGLCLDLLT